MLKKKYKFRAGVYKVKTFRTTHVAIPFCRVLKAWHLYTRSRRYGMGKGGKNKVLKLTPAKVKYIIRAKINNVSSRIISN
jgi:hypothetical protein